MYTFPTFSALDGQPAVLIRSRSLVVTNSASVAFMKDDKRELFPLISSAEYHTLLPDGVVNCFTIEASGYLVLSPGAQYNIHETGTFTSFNFAPSDVRQVEFVGFAACRILSIARGATAPAPIVSPLFPSNFVCTTIIVTLSLPDADGYSGYEIEFAHPIDSSLTDPFITDFFKVGALWRGATAYPADFGMNPF